MDAQSVTILSGVALLAVFALAGWRSKLRRDRRARERSDSADAR